MALWLEKEHGVAGLSERLEKLSVDYQTERSTLEGNDPTRLAVGALLRISRETLEDPLIFETGELTRRTNELAEELELSTPDSDKPFTNTIRVGRLLERLRLEKAPRSSKRKRWLIAREQLDTLAKSYGLAMEGAGRVLEGTEQPDVPRETAPGTLRQPGTLGTPGNPAL